MDDTMEATPEESGTVEEPVEKVETPEEPEGPTPEELAEQRFKSWLGRRDKELLGTIKGLIDEKLATRKPEPEPDEDTTVFDDPDKWLDKKLTEKTRTVEQYQGSLITEAGAIMDNDPLFEDKELGAAVVKEIQANFNRFVEPNVPVKVQAERMVDRALKSVIRASKLASPAGNALSGNKPGAAPGAGLTPTKPSKPKAKIPKLDDYTREFAKKWGYDDDALAEVFAGE